MGTLIYVVGKVSDGTLKTNVAIDFTGLSVGALQKKADRSDQYVVNPNHYLWLFDVTCLMDGKQFYGATILCFIISLLRVQA